MHPLVNLVRRYCVDYVNRHDFSVLREIIEPDYRLHVGGFTLVGRDETYIPTMTKAFAEYPDFGITVHDLFTDGSLITMRFSLHSTSATRHSSAVWSGVVTYAWNGERITEAWAEEDFFGRRRQIRTGTPDALEAPHPDPWSAKALPRDMVSEQTVRDWLATGTLDQPEVETDDRAVAGTENQPQVAVDDVTVDVVCALRDRVSFRVQQHGTYQGGFEDLDALIGRPVTRGVSGVAELVNGELVRVRAFTDRLELLRRLKGQAEGTAPALVGRSSLPPSPRKNSPEI